MTEASQSKLDSILRKVQALLANADDEGNTPEARESYRQKAEALMFTYRIEENQIAQAGGAAAEGIRPVWRKIWVTRTGSEFSRTYAYMAAQALSHVDAEYQAEYDRNAEDGNRMWYVFNAVGYDSDLRYAELLITSMIMGFAGKMEPKVDPTKSDAENAYILRSAGMEGRRIAMLLWGSEDKPLRAKARKLFAQWAQEHGEDPSDLLGRGNNVRVFRESYAEGFESEMWSRLARMRQSHGDKELVLGNRKQLVKEALYERYPARKPRPVNPNAKVIGGRDTCEKCRKAASGYCREHQYLKPRAGRYVERAFSSAGYTRGGVAARSVDLGGRGTGRVTGGTSRRSLG